MGAIRIKCFRKGNENLLNDIKNAGITCVNILETFLIVCQRIHISERSGKHRTSVEKRHIVRYRQNET